MIEKSLITNNYLLFAGDLKQPEEIIKVLQTNKIDFELKLFTIFIYENLFLEIQLLYSQNAF